jgi:hypothetical protein
MVDETMELAPTIYRVGDDDQATAGDGRSRSRLAERRRSDEAGVHAVVAQRAGITR